MFKLTYGKVLLYAIISAVVGYIVGHFAGTHFYESFILWPITILLTALVVDAIILGFHTLVSAELNVKEKQKFIWQGLLWTIAFCVIILPVYLVWLLSGLGSFFKGPI